MAQPSVVDWDLAVTTARRLSGPGPAVSRDEADAVVRDLYERAARAVGYVADCTGLSADGPASVAVVGREAWVRSNVDGFREVVDPLLLRIRARRGGGAVEPHGVTHAVGSRLTGAEVGAALGYLSGKVLGQYELFVAPGAQPRLMLVAPNIVAVEREMGVDPGDFRLWVAIHEETHRVQFGAVPWLRPWLTGEVEGYLDAVDVDLAAVMTRLRELGGAALASLRGLDATAILDLVTTPEQRAVLRRLTAVMSLLEGHADYVMDRVGPQVVPSVATLRERFQRRRSEPGPVDGFVRRLLGLDAKLAQYRDGEAFVRAVVDQVGMTGFNRVWEAPATLPDAAELADPGAWVARVHGTVRA